MSNPCLKHVERENWIVKIIYLIALLTLTGGGWLQAQTNACKTARDRRLLRNTWFYSNGSRQVIYTGNVRVDDPQMKLTCEQLTADLPLPAATLTTWSP